MYTAAYGTDAESLPEDGRQYRAHCLLEMECAAQIMANVECVVHKVIQMNSACEISDLTGNEVALQSTD